MRAAMMALILAAMVAGCRTTPRNDTRPAGWPNEDVWHHGGLQ